MTLAAIKARLYRGFHPEDFGGKDIGAGVFRTAYRVGDYVIKHKGRHCGQARRKSTVREELASIGILMSPEWRVRRRGRRTWVIQPWYRRVNWRRSTRLIRSDQYCNATLLDLHTDNLGYDREWNLVAFDY